MISCSAPAGSSGLVVFVLSFSQGQDDLRQDAVMQQVFAVMNTLLSTSKETQQRRLKIRTYKVILKNSLILSVESHPPFPKTKRYLEVLFLETVTFNKNFSRNVSPVQ